VIRKMQELVLSMKLELAQFKELNNMQKSGFTFYGSDIQALDNILRSWFEQLEKMLAP
jgi:hypothetical protein